MLSFFTLLLLTATTNAGAGTFPDHFFKPSIALSPPQTPPLLRKYQEYLEVTHPLPSDNLAPSCTLHVIHHSFAHTIDGPPYTVPYSPPSNCPPPWSHITLEFLASSKGDQYDRISGLWLGGVELLRTSTAEPTSKGIFWKVRKDVTKYSSLLRQHDLNFTMMLENVVNSVYTGVYDVHVNVLFYTGYAVSDPSLGGDKRLRILGSEVGLMGDLAADLIIPVSFDDGLEKGFWFLVKDESDVHFKEIRFPNNTWRAVLELYVSFHGNDEFWYSNPSNSYIRTNNLETSRGNGAFREVFVTIDGRIVGFEVPFPVVFTGGINPLFWEPVVAIGAFNLPSYDFDLTPFLGLVLDGKDHVFGVGVTDGISYWLVDANLHIWLDSGLSSVMAKSVVDNKPESVITREEEFDGLDGNLEITGRRKTRSVGWVISSLGNLTTSVKRQFRFANLIRFTKNGTFKYVKQKIKVRREVKVLNHLGHLLSRVSVRRKYPLKVITSSLPWSKEDTYMLVTNVSHAFTERYANGESLRRVSNKQIANGWMEVKDHDVLSGKAITNQTFTYTDEFACYIRTVAAANGRLIFDATSYVCPSVM